MVSNGHCDTAQHTRALNYLHYGSGHLHQINFSLRDAAQGDALAVHQLICDIERDALHRETGRSQGRAQTRFALDPLGRRLGAWSQPGAPGAGAAAGFSAQDKGWQQAILSAGTPQASVRNGLMKAYAYDKVGELRQSRHSLQGDWAHAYDATGRIVQTVHQPFASAQTARGAGSEHFAYDPAGNILDTATQAALARRTQHPQAAYVHDNLVRVLGDKRFFYDGHGRLTEKRIAQHTVQHFAWDDENRLTEVITTRRPGTAHAITQTTRFDYDALGRRVAKHDAFGTTTFIWEGMRLIEERRGSSVISYVYEPGSYVPLARLDALGEHTAKGGLGTQDDVPTPNTAPAGEAANDESASLHPNASRTMSDAEARYWASLEHTAEQALDRTIEEHWGGNLPEPEPQLAKVYYFHNSPVGLPEELTNAQGQIVWQASYKTWGNTIQEQWGWVNLDGTRVFEQDKGDMPDEEAREQNLRFQGQYLDRDTGLHYNTFRYYDPDLGRFISPDPIGLFGGHNLHSYSPNPISWIDPWGWCGDGNGLTGRNWEFNRDKDVDMRGGASYRDALDEAFRRTGIPREQFVVTKWGKTADGKSIPVEYQAPNGANVNMDIPAWNNRTDNGIGNGPHQPHIGYQTPGKGTSRTRGHIFVDNIPATRE